VVDDNDQRPFMWNSFLYLAVVNPAPSICQPPNNFSYKAPL
jgi:hypothetical protein